MSQFDNILIEKEEFIRILLSTNRDGIDELLKYLETTDFFIAPSSTKYHDTEVGGLLHHSLNVYGNLIRLNNVFQGDYPEDTLKIVGTAILLRLIETGFEKNYNGDFVDHFEIVTTGKIPHVSKRCALCGMQLNQDEQKYGACSSCHAEEVN